MERELKTEAGKMRAETIRQLRRDRRVPEWWATKALAEADNAIPSVASAAAIGLDRFGPGLRGARRCVRPRRAACRTHRPGPG